MRSSFQKCTSLLLLGVDPSNTYNYQGCYDICIGIGIGFISDNFKKYQISVSGIFLRYPISDIVPLPVFIIYSQIFISFHLEAIFTFLGVTLRNLAKVTCKICKFTYLYIHLPQKLCSTWWTFMAYRILVSVRISYRHRPDNYAF